MCGREEFGAQPRGAPEALNNYWRNSHHCQNIPYLCFPMLLTMNEGSMVMCTKIDFGL